MPGAGCGHTPGRAGTEATIPAGPVLVPVPQMIAQLQNWLAPGPGDRALGSVLAQIPAPRGPVARRGCVHLGGGGGDRGRRCAWSSPPVRAACHGESGLDPFIRSRPIRQKWIPVEPWHGLSWLGHSPPNQLENYLHSLAYYACYINCYEYF